MLSHSPGNWHTPPRPLSLPVPHSRSLQKPSVPRGEKVTLHPQTPPELFHQFLKLQRKRPRAGHQRLVVLLRRDTSFPTCPRCMKQGHGLLWWTETFSFQWIRPQKVKACVPRWRTVIIQTSGKCASPHERREQNGIKLDQGRVYFSKRKQDMWLKYRLQR